MAAKRLRDSGYDGPFIGPITEDLFEAINKAEESTSKYKWVFKLKRKNANEELPNNSVITYFWIVTRSYWIKHNSISRCFHGTKIPEEIYEQVHECAPSTFYTYLNVKDLRELMRNHGIIEVY